MKLKLLQKEQLKKMLTWLVIKSQIKLQKSQAVATKDFRTVTNELDKETPKERHVSPEEKQKIIDDLRLIVTKSIK